MTRHNRDTAPFREGDLVKIRGGDHLGLHRVESCEWFERTNRDVHAYWLCECAEVREPIDWSRIPAGATGIVTGSWWRGDAVHLIAVAASDAHARAALTQGETE